MLRCCIAVYIFGFCRCCNAYSYNREHVNGLEASCAVIGRSCVVVTAAVVNGSYRGVTAAVVNRLYGGVATAVVNGSYVVVASTVVTVHPVVLHIALTGSIVHLITSVIIHNVLLSGKLHRKVRLHVYSMNNCGIGAYNWAAENTSLPIDFSA